MSQTKSYQFLSKKQAVKIIVWSIFNKKPFLIYAEAVLMGVSATIAYQEALRSITEQKITEQ